jgi:hypothetical protein
MYINYSRGIGFIESQTIIKRVACVAWKWLTQRAIALNIGMKTEQKRTELSDATFVFIFLCESRNEYRNTGNKYENGYFRKQTWNEYCANLDEKRMIIGTKRPPESCSKTKASQVYRKTYSLNLSKLLSVMGSRGELL